MEERKLQVELILANEKLADEKAKMVRFMKFLKMYENDMDFECTTVLEENMRDNLNDIFKEAHKQYDSISEVK